jgi:hypothetical protein
MTSAHRTTERTKLRPCCFRAMYRIRLPASIVGIGLIALWVKGFICRSEGYVLNGTFLVLQWPSSKAMLQYLVLLFHFPYVSRHVLLNTRNKRKWKLKNSAFVLCQPCYKYFSFCHSDFLEH